MRIIAVLLFAAIFMFLIVTMSLAIATMLRKFNDSEYENVD